MGSGHLPRTKPFAWHLRSSVSSTSLLKTLKSEQADNQKNEASSTVTQHSSDRAGFELMSIHQKLAQLLALPWLLDGVDQSFFSLRLNSSIYKMRELTTSKSPPSSDIPSFSLNPLLLSLCSHIFPATVVETCEVAGFLGHKQLSCCNFIEFSLTLLSFHFLADFLPLYLSP